MGCRPQTHPHRARYFLCLITVSNQILSKWFVGSYGASGIYSCPFSDCYRVSPDKNGKLVPTNKGRWILGQPFTLNRRQELYEKLQEESGGNPRKLAQLLKTTCKGCKYPPCDIVDESYWNEPIITFLGPQPLHLFAGTSSCIFAYFFIFLYIRCGK